MNHVIITMIFLFLLYLSCAQTIYTSSYSLYETDIIYFNNSILNNNIINQLNDTINIEYKNETILIERINKLNEALSEYIILNDKYKSELKSTNSKLNEYISQNDILKIDNSQLEETSVQKSTFIIIIVSIVVGYCLIIMQYMFIILLLSKKYKHKRDIEKMNLIDLNEQ